MSNRASLTILFLFSIIFSFFTVLDFGSDYSFYYAAANFISEDFRLYKEMFSHKGPGVYSVIKALTNVIGFGVWQYFFTFFTFFSIFILSFYYLILKKIDNSMNLAFMLFFISLFFNLNSNSFIQILISTCLLFSFYHYEKYQKLNYLYSLLTSFAFVFLAILIRIDNLIFLLPLIITTVIKNYKNSFIVFMKTLVFLGIISFTLYFIFSTYFNFTFDEYFSHNFIFNSTYGQPRDLNFVIRIISKFIRPNLILFLSISGIIYVIANNLKLYVKLNLFRSLFLVIPFLFLIYTGSDKDYHFMIFSMPFLYVSSKLEINWKPIISFSICSIILLGYNFKENIIQANSKYVQIQNNIFFLQKHQFNKPIIGGSGRINLVNIFSKDLKIPPQNDWFLYEKKSIIFNNKFLTSTKKSLFASDTIVVNKSLLQNESYKILLDEFTQIDKTESIILFLKKQ